VSRIMGINRKGRLALFASLIAAPAFAQDADTIPKKGPLLEFERTEISDTVVIKTSNTVTLKSKDYKYAEFRFVNKGDEPLFIEKVTQPEPCFSGEWPREAIKPGEGGVIRVSCAARPNGNDLVMGFTITSNDPSGLKLVVLKRHFIMQK
jgi:hypothetical protein